MKLSGIIAPLALAGAASALAIPKAEIASELSEATNGMCAIQK
jgi:hypothetical protein